MPDPNPSRGKDVVPRNRWHVRELRKQDPQAKLTAFEARDPVTGEVLARWFFDVGYAFGRCEADKFTERYEGFAVLQGAEINTIRA